MKLSDLLPLAVAVTLASAESIPQGCKFIYYFISLVFASSDPKMHLVNHSHSCCQPLATSFNSISIQSFFKK